MQMLHAYFYDVSLSGIYLFWVCLIMYVVHLRTDIQKTEISSNLLFALLKKTLFMDYGVVSFL